MTDNNTLYDIIIIGGGPAGYTAALYSARAGFNVLIIEKFSAGGQMCQTAQIDNYPGFDESVDGYDLGYKMQRTAERFGAKTLLTEVKSVTLTSKIKVIATDKGVFKANAVIIATGADHRHAGLKGEDEMRGHGLGYCGACDGMFFKGKKVAVFGGGNSASADATLLSKICEKVSIIFRRDKLTADKVYQNGLYKAANVEFINNSVIDEIIYDEKVRGLKIRNRNDNTTRILDIDGVFISIGRIPETSLFKGQLALDEGGYIIAGEDTKTNIEGVFAAGDVRTKEFRQIVTATADGAIAAHFAEKYLSQL